MYSPFSYKNIQEKLSMINVGGGCGEFVIINMNEIRRFKRSIGNNISGYYLLWIQKDGKRNKNLF